MEFKEYYSSTGEKSDKGTYHDYINSFYSDEFTPLKDTELTIVEIGVLQGHSLELFSGWFTNANIIGIDNGQVVKPIWMDNIQNIPNTKLILGDAYSDEIVSQFEDESIDYLIDDGPHTLNSQLDCIKLYWPKIKIGGQIIIEDVLNIDGVKHYFDSIANDMNITYNIIDIRKNKNRFDDVLLIFKK
jgi:hypothetical protein